ncbi:MAG: hypothetical protein M3O41_10260, partial [Pseudomonadota bacterium]|nr:hypothetical protein [Pseudomonadota bacterium]
QSSYVQDATSDSIGQVNMITCVMSSMRPDALVNQGPYVALVDRNVCDATKSSGATSGAGAGAAQAPNYMTAVVNSTRASNSDPMIVKAWISVDQQGTPVTVFAHISATESPSAANPYGAFRLDFCGKDSSSSACLMNGFIQGGSGTLSYYEADNNPGGSQTTALQLSSVGTTSGSGSVSMQQSGNGGSSSSAFDFAYDQNYFLRSDSQSSSECFSRDATDPATGLSVWQYGLYDAVTGARVQRNSGFPVQYTSGGTTYQGYIGYYGLSLQSGAPSPVNGSTIQKVDYQGGAATTANFTVVTNGGRLTRYTRQTRTLQSIDKVHFDVWLGDVTPFGLPDPNTQYEMYWDEASAKFIVTGEQRCDQSGCQLSNLSATVSLDPSLWANMGGVQAWSQSLGGDLFINLGGVSGSINSAAITVVYHVQDLVYPDDSTMPATLYCANNCPTVASLQAYFTQGQGGSVASPYVAATYNNFQPVALASLTTYSVTAAVLSDSSNQPVIDTSSSDYQSYPQYQNGLMSGRLFANLSDAQCPDNATPPDYCDYQVNSAGTYYEWQTGPGGWNQFAAVKDSSGSFVHFDAPLNVNFAVPTDAAYGSYGGTAIVLQYNGFGDLWGIPGSCVSQTTNMPVDCSTPNSRYVPQFVIPYDPTAAPQRGVVTTTAGGVTTTYLAKWLQREIRFAVKPASVCANDNLQSPTGVQLPVATSLKNPSDSSSDIYLGTQPTLTSAPRVIQGVVKY